MARQRKRNRSERRRQTRADKHRHRQALRPRGANGPVQDVRRRGPLAERRAPAEGKDQSEERAGDTRKAQSPIDRSARSSHKTAWMRSKTVYGALKEPSSCSRKTQPSGMR
jgi:hypothetical protein